VTIAGPVAHGAAAADTPRGGPAWDRIAPAALAGVAAALLALAAPRRNRRARRGDRAAGETAALGG
jgi:hypothetical protein